jgi:hypothetical protein
MPKPTKTSSAPRRRGRFVARNDHHLVQMAELQRLLPG